MEIGIGIYNLRQACARYYVVVSISVILMFARTSRRFSTIKKAGRTKRARHHKQTHTDSRLSPYDDVKHGATLVNPNHQVRFKIKFWNLSTLLSAPPSLSIIDVNFAPNLYVITDLSFIRNSFVRVLVKPYLPYMCHTVTHLIYMFRFKIMFIKNMIL
jgi:hypothetical protein